ncbi:MAG: transglutaminase-like domain-containing protein [Phycisphaerae bacterium]
MNKTMRKGLGRILLIATALALRASDPVSLAAAAPAVIPNAAARARAAWALLEHNERAELPGTLMIEPTHAVEARLGFVAETPNLTPTAWIAYAAIPPNLPTQRVATFSITRRTMELPDMRVPSRRFLVAVSSGESAHTFQIGAVYQLQLYKRTFIAGSFKSQPAAPASKALNAELAQALVASETLDFDTPAFQAALEQNDLRPHQDETELDFARRAFTTLRSQLHYEYRADLDRRSSAVWQSTKSDCGGINGLFVSVMRANGIPARTLCGRWARSSKDSDTLNGLPYAQWHVKAEFFLPRVGWIPIDLSGAVQCAPANDPGLAWFGSDRGDFITMHTDFDLMVDALRFGRQHIVADQGFAYWVTGTGNMNGHTSHETWQVRELAGIANARP